MYRNLVRGLTRTDFMDEFLIVLVIYVRKYADKEKADFFYDKSALGVLLVFAVALHGTVGH